MSYAVMLMLIALAAAGGNIIKPPTASRNEIVDYSQLVERDEAETLAAVKRLRQEVIDLCWRRITVASSS